MEQRTSEFDAHSCRPYSVPDYYWILGLFVGGLAITGNFVVILVMFLGRVKRTSTNIFITNLALTDFLTGLLLIVFKVFPFRFSQPHADNHFLVLIFCHVYCTEFPLWSMINVSVLNLILLTLDRYLAVTRPIDHRTTFNEKLPITVCLTLIWFLGIAASVQNLWLVEDEKCAMSPSLGNAFWLWTASWSLFGMLLVPFIVMSAFYCHIWCIVYQMPSGGKSRQIRLTISCFAVLATFLLCWLPDQIYYFYWSIKGLESEPEPKPEFISKTPSEPVSFCSNDWTLYHLVVTLGYMNSFINPILYAFLNPSYSNAFKKLIGIKTRSQTTTSYTRGKKGTTLRAPANTNPSTNNTTSL